MTDAANGPAAGADASGADNRNAATVITDGGSNGDAGIKVAGPLNEDNRALVEAKKWAGEDGSIDLNKIADGYRNLETHASKSLSLPGENATKEDWDKFYSKLGRPEKPDGYELKLNREAIPENFPYDEQGAIEFRNIAHQTGQTPKQAQEMHDWYVAKQAAAYRETQEALAKREADEHRAITQKYGDPDTPAYKEAVEFASRTIRQEGLKDELERFGMLGPDGSIRSQRLFDHFRKVGKELYAEDTMATNASGALNNPFSDGANFNLTRQGEVIRSDPRKAKALITAAGKNPADFGLKASHPER